MRCYKKSSVMAINTTEQAVAANGIVGLDTGKTTGCSIRYVSGSNAVLLKNAGLYYVSVHANVEGTAAGAATLQLLNNNVAVAGAAATTTLANGSTANMSFDAVVNVLPSCNCINNIGSLQVQLSAAATVSSIEIVVIKLA